MNQSANSDHTNSYRSLDPSEKPYSLSSVVSFRASLCIFDTMYRSGSASALTSACEEKRKGADGAAEALPENDSFRRRDVET